MWRVRKNNYMQINSVKIGEIIEARVKSESRMD